MPIAEDAEEDVDAICDEERRVDIQLLVKLVPAVDDIEGGSDVSDGELGRLPGMLVSEAVRGSNECFLWTLISSFSEGEDFREAGGFRSMIEEPAFCKSEMRRLSRASSCSSSIIVVDFSDCLFQGIEPLSCSLSSCRSLSSFDKFRAFAFSVKRLNSCFVSEVEAMLGWLARVSSTESLAPSMSGWSETVEA